MPYTNFTLCIDQILLDEDDPRNEDNFEEEVFALQGISEDDDDEFGENGEVQDITMDDEEIPAKQRKSKSKSKKTKASSPPVEEEEEETWGLGKHAYYSSNAGQIESDDEEAQDLEEQEARRLQAKARDEMHDDDFGFGENVEGDIEPDDTQHAPEHSEALEVLVPVVKDIPQDKQSLLRFLERENPEAVALARDWEDTALDLVETKARVDA